LNTGDHLSGFPKTVLSPDLERKKIKRLFSAYYSPSRQQQHDWNILEPPPCPAQWSKVIEMWTGQHNRISMSERI
jgi:hypothetical protein